MSGDVVAIVASMLPMVIFPTIMYCALNHSSPSRRVYFIHCRRKYSGEVEKRLNFLVGKYYAGLVTLEVDEYSMTFSDGTEVWTANRYYSAGHIYGELNNGYPGYSTWRELMHIYSEKMGMDDRTLYEKLTGKFSPKKKTTVIVDLNNIP